MLISAIQKCTLLDYPQKTACIVFTPGCNMRCGYCHNAEFVLPEKIALLRDTFIPEESFFNFLNTRVGILDGVVISGGEPTLMPDLIECMKKIKVLGFLVKLDTNGNRPEVIERALASGVVDYIALDIKTALDEYVTLTGKQTNKKNIARSIELLMRGKVEYEFRSTLIKQIHSPAILEHMAAQLRGAKRLFVQTFRPTNTLDPIFQNYQPFSEPEMQNIAALFRKEVRQVEVR